MSTTSSSSSSSSTAAADADDDVSSDASCQAARSAITHVVVTHAPQAALRAALAHQLRDQVDVGRRPVELRQRPCTARDSCGNRRSTPIAA